MPRFQPETFAQNLELVAVVEAVAGEKAATPAQVALAWVLSRGEDVVPIPGTKRRKYLEENVGALEIELTADDLERLETAFPEGATARDRHEDIGTVHPERIAGPQDCKARRRSRKQKCSSGCAASPSTVP